MHVLISGSTGLLASALVPRLVANGDRVTRLVRATDVSGVRWDPSCGELDATALEGIDAVVHFSGESIAAGRWTASRRASILESRVKSTELIASTIARMPRPPRTLVVASAVGIDGNRGDERLTEESTAGDFFLTHVCQSWEEAAAPARAAGIRVVHPRFGIILSKKGGALKPLLLAFNLMAGGPIGDGKQWWSWIAIDDVVGALMHILRTESLVGPVNVTAPNPATNRDFVRALGRVLHRPSFMPLPAFAARIILGQMADELLLQSARVEPRRLLESGYSFAYPELEPALRHVLDRQ
jgi:hypothetical protein